MGAAFTTLNAAAMDYYRTTYWPDSGVGNSKHPTPALVRFVNSYSNVNRNLFAAGLTADLGYDFVFSDNMNLSIEYRFTIISKNFKTNYSNPNGGTDTVTAYTYYYTSQSSPYNSSNKVFNIIAPTSQKISLTSSQLTARLNISLDAILNSSGKRKK